MKLMAPRTTTHRETSSGDPIYNNYTAKKRETEPCESPRAPPTSHGFILARLEKLEKMFMFAVQSKEKLEARVSLLEGKLGYFEDLNFRQSDVLFNSTVGGLKSPGEMSCDEEYNKMNMDYGAAEYDDNMMNYHAWSETDPGMCGNQDSYAAQEPSIYPAAEPMHPHEPPAIHTKFSDAPNTLAKPTTLPSFLTRTPFGTLTLGGPAAESTPAGLTPDPPPGLPQPASKLTSPSPCRAPPGLATPEYPPTGEAVSNRTTESTESSSHVTPSSQAIMTPVPRLAAFTWNPKESIQISHDLFGKTTKVTWRIDNIKGKLKMGAGKPLVSPQFHIDSIVNEGELKLMLFPYTGDHLGERNGKELRTRERQQRFEQLVNTGPLGAALRIKSSGQHAHKLRYRLSIGNVNLGTFQTDFSDHIVHGTDDNGVEDLLACIDSGKNIAWCVLEILPKEEPCETSVKMDEIVAKMRNAVTSI